MGKPTVGTTVQKFHCQCQLEDGKEVFIAVKADTEAGATEKVHNGYPSVEYVLDILTPLQMEYRKRHLRKYINAGVSTYQ